MILFIVIILFALAVRPNLAASCAFMTLIGVHWLVTGWRLWAALAGALWYALAS
jgi:hypothetical protein